MNRSAPVIAALVVGLFGMCGAMLGGWFLLAAGAQVPDSCMSAGGSLDEHSVPAELRPIFAAAAERYHLGPEGPPILAGLTKVESDFGRNMGPSSAGAVGWTQFMPETWRQYGVDADGDGRRDPMIAMDAIFASAHYLHALGAPGSWRRAIFGYNHADWYVDEVLAKAHELAAAPPAGAPAELDVLACASATTSDVSTSGSGGRIIGGGRIVAIPWQPEASVDERILADLQILKERFHIAITDGYSTSSVHAAAGEHPLGLGVDIVPGPGGTWDDIDRLARIAEPQQNHPVSPWRWVGYDGDTNHGRGNHLHLSWQHGAAAPGYRPPAAWVRVMAAAG